MSARTQPKIRDRMSQDKLNSLIIKKEPQAETSEQKPARPMLFSEEEYDTLHPEEKIRDFCSYIRQAIAQYEYNKEQLSSYEARIQDLLHYAEMGKSRDAAQGYKFYKELSEVRKLRRACKNEIDLLYPVYELFHGTRVLEQLSNVQGNCRTVKNAISNKGYTIRTDVLDQFMK